MKTTHWILGSLVAALLALTGCSDDGADVDEADSVTTATTTPATTDTTADEATTTEPPRAPATFVAEAPVFTATLGPAEPGTYRVDILGTPFTFTIDQPLYVQTNGFAQFVITDPGSRGPDDRDIVMLRLSTLSDPSMPSVLPETREAGWPATDLDGWLDSLGDSLIVSNSEATTLGGLDATRVDLQLGENECRPRQFCVILGTNQGIVVSKDLIPDSTYSIWVVDQGTEDPLVVIAGIARDDDTAWFDTVDEIFATLAFGEVGPNPIIPVPSGRIELPFLGGIETELATDGLVLDEWAGLVIAPADAPWDTQFLTNPRDLDGNVLETTDALVQVLQEEGTAVTEVESEVVGGFGARVFDIGSSSFNSALQPSSAADTVWFAPLRGRIWLVEHPARGLLMITVEVFDDVDQDFPPALASTQAIVETLEFIDLG